MIYLKKAGRYPTMGELIEVFQAVRKLTGRDLPIVGGGIMDDTAIHRITILKKDNTEWFASSPDKPTGIFIE